jgi:hypothetical protein
VRLACSGAQAKHASVRAEGARAVCYDLAS